MIISLKIKAFEKKSFEPIIVQLIANCKTKITFKILQQRKFDSLEVLNISKIINIFEMIK